MSAQRDSTSHHNEADGPVLLSVSEVAEMLQISPRHLYSLKASGRLPKPVRLGRSVRWLADELRAWLEAGAPPQGRWEKMRHGHRQ